MILVLVCCLGYYFEKSGSDYTYKVYKVNDGYGYQIHNDNKLFIKQDFIPTIDGYKAFASEQHARVAAQKVIAKLKEKQAPALSHQEIEQIIR
ncbi:DUF4907 domain-containing protein [Carboxylicivirga sp. A043]|uniref:DUF4907 domain-containing protein n=1 Tax=Carboxylicivirga litoralis TaxID=2816963 RepID=UPI0021CB473E|nr:DUF4907 domain-containing protein [Carboxylicivirga sp. A043]MCU4155807.1 DUF4907 domain-containing protein [Carboxylicivirga sp. A043]